MFKTCLKVISYVVRRLTNGQFSSRVGAGAGGMIAVLASHEAVTKIITITIIIILSGAWCWLGWAGVGEMRLY